MRTSGYTQRSTAIRWEHAYDLSFSNASVTDSGVVAGMGSVLLIPELLTTPLRDSANGEQMFQSLAELVSL